ncbi:Protein kinase domain-containing protein [Mucor velutinosus]|uniref:Protein kinase domain-containing protein n=1 Tax=Mucor velutinosus TaxID=708070 RepID=A0AAN7I189_9FUNG|nr:Protein kinase domain-containing protein [Mucor velutinosus]
MRKPTEQDLEELCQHMILFDMTDDRRGHEPHAVPERLMNSFQSSRGFKYQNIASFSTSRHRDEPSNVFESMQYMEYVADRRYDAGDFARIGKMSNNMKLYLYYPTRQYQLQSSNGTSGRDRSRRSSSRSRSPPLLSHREPSRHTPPLTQREVVRQANRDIDPYAIDKAIAAKPELIQLTPESIHEKVKILQKIFAAYFPTYYMQLTPFGSTVSGIAFPSSKLDINIEMDIPDMKRLLMESPSMGSAPQPDNYEYMSNVLQSLGATKVNYNETLSSTSFLIDHLRYEYSFNRGIVTKSTDLIQEYIKLDNRVLPFIKTLKYFGRGRNIFAPALKFNGIRSYAYVVMALSFLISLEPPVLPNLQNINHQDICDLCVSDDCATKKMFWETALHNHIVVGAAARFHDCIKHDETASPCTYRVKKNGSDLYWNSSNKATVGELFIDFMYYYGYDFDYKNFAVSLKMGGRTLRKDEFKNDMLVIEDPILSSVNLGAGITDGQGLQKFQHTLRGAFTLLYGGVPYDQVITNTPDIHQYDCLQGVGAKRPKYRPFLRMKWAPSTKTIALIGLPKIPEADRERVCYCDRIKQLFASYGDVDRIIDLDYTVKQLTFTDVRRNVNDIIIPTSFMFEGKKVYLVELYDSVLPPSA